MNNYTANVVLTVLLLLVIYGVGTCSVAQSKRAEIERASRPNVKLCTNRLDGQKIKIDYRHNLTERVHNLTGPSWVTFKDQVSGELMRMSETEAGSWRCILRREE